MSKSPHTQDCVFLLHGLARTYRSMRPVQRFLENQGLAVFNWNYPSRHHSIETLSDTFLSQAIADCQTHYKPQRLHFVTHSMGALVLRQHLKNNRLSNLGRVVMIAPPNQGSQIVDRIGAWPLFRWINGPAGNQLGTRNTDMAAQLGPITFEAGVIAGNKSWNLALSTLLPRPNDGKVAVANTRVEGMSDFVVVACTHSFIMSNPDVMRMTWQFLRTGKFLDS